MELEELHSKWLAYSMDILISTNFHKEVISGNLLIC